MLLGQNVNSYGKNLEEGISFASLLKQLDKMGIPRIRFMTSHPKDTSSDLVSVIKEYSPKIAPFFHLPLQSGSNAILKAMNRTYTREKYLSIAFELKDNIPGIALSTDVIIGFPGESDEDFSDTMDILRKVEFDNVYAFLYSPREGTKAAKMEGFVDREIKDKRMAELLAFQDKLSLERNMSYEGRTCRVLVDSFEDKEGKRIYSARTLTNKLVYFEMDGACVGNFVDIKIDKACPYHLMGKKKED
jgi:tRNA-2-methylthio-N6-dimethylallyladenosine synthase